MPARIFFVSLVVALTFIQPGLCQRPRIPIPPGFGGLKPPVFDGPSVTIAIANPEEVIGALPDTEIVKDLLRGIDSDLWTIAFHDGDDGLEASDVIAKLIKLSAPESVKGFVFRKVNGVATYTISPVEDFEDFVDTIDYGVVLSENSTDQVIKVEIAIDEIKQENLIARAEKRGQDAVDDLMEVLEGKKKGRRQAKTEAVPTNQLGADFDAGDYVEATIAGTAIAGRILTSKIGRIEQSLFRVEILHHEELAKLTRDRRLRRRVEKAEGIAMWLPAGRLMKLPGPPTPPQEERNWADRTGSFSVDATYVKLAADRVVLRLASGKEVKVPLAKLSDEDREYVDALNQISANPFASTTTASRSLRADWSQAREITVQNSAKWRWKPPAVSRVKPVETPFGRFDLDTPLGQGPSGTKLEGLYLSADGTAGIAVMDAGHMSTKTHLQQLDLAKGTVADRITCPIGSKVLDARPEDNLVLLATAKRGIQEDSRVFLRRLVDGELEPISDFATLKPGGRSADISRGRLLPGSRLVTWTDRDQLTIWDHSQGKALYTVEIDAGHEPPLVVGPSGRFIFAGGSKVIAVVDIKAGKVVASIPHSLGYPESIAVDRKMKRLALTAGDKVFTIDLTNGKVIHSLFGFSGRGDIDFLGKFLLYDNRYIVAPKYPVMLWQYVMADGASYDSHAAVRGRRLWYATRQGKREAAAWSVASIALPHEAVRNRLKELGDLDDMILLTQGDPVTIKTDTDLDAATTNRLEKAITKAFRAAGYEIVAPSAADEKTKEVVITCKKAAKPIKVMIANPDAKPPADNPTAIQVPRGFYIPRMRPGFFGGGGFDWMYEPHSVTPYLSAITIRHQDKTLWTDVTEVQDGEQFSPLGEQTVQSILNKITTPDIERLMKTELPAQICRKGSVGGTFGASFINADGIAKDYLGEEE